jgi:hypothetical protein
MDTLIGLGGMLLFIGLMAALFGCIQRAQREDNRNSNANQSSYVTRPPAGDG